MHMKSGKNQTILQASLLLLCGPILLHSPNVILKKQLCRQEQKGKERQGQNWDQEGIKDNFHTLQG